MTDAIEHHKPRTIMSIYLRAYKAYQQENYDQCLRFLQELKSNDVKRLDLQAQVHFRKKEFQNAYDIYQDLIERETEYRDERKENVQAIIACAQLEQPGQLKTRQNLPDASAIIDQVQQINLKDETVCELSLKPQKSNNRKKNKKRKIRLPKQYDAVAGPDPERWIPRRDRKGNAHKQKKRRQRPNAPKGKSRGK